MLAVRRSRQAGIAIPTSTLIYFYWTIMNMKCLTSALVLVFGGTAAQAHHVWIEQPAGSAAMLRFGEFGDNLREASPGLLDRFGKPTALRISAKGQEPLTVTKKTNGFELSGSAAQGDSIVVEDRHYPLYTQKQAKGWYLPAARYLTNFAAQAPALVFDVVPTGREGEFKVVFKGQPLPKVKVSAVVQSGWSKEAYSDAQGIVKFDMPWQGDYVFEAGHVDRSPGERAGETGSEKYDTVNYVTSVTVSKTDGLDALPAGPAGTPAK